MQSNKRIYDSYTVVRELARGAMGELLLAVRQQDGVPVVLKRLRVSLRGLPDATERLRREAAMTARVDSPHVIEVLEVVEDEQEGPVLVFEYLKGKSLDLLLKRRGRMPLNEVFPIVEQVLAGLAACHVAGVVHRDIKPGNIFLVEKPGESSPLVKLIDFGAGKPRLSSSSDEVLTKAGQNMGTFAYMSPEQSRSPSEVDERTDLYSTGVLIFRMLTKQWPHPGANLVQLLQMKQRMKARRLNEVLIDTQARVPQRFDDFVASLLERDPDDRPQTALEALNTWRTLAL